MYLETKEAGEAEVTEAPAKVMKLSKAIRIGARIRPQGFGAYFHVGRSCALGAAFEGMKGRPANSIGRLIWDELGISPRLHDRIVDLNDAQHWTREQIADWLEAEGY